MNISALKGKSYKGQVITDSIRFAELLLEHEMVAVVPGAAFSADDFVRLSYATSDKNIQRGMERIIRFAEECK